MEAQPMEGRGFGKAMTLGLAGLVAVCLIYVAMMSGPLSKASADSSPFCTNVSLAPYGSYGDRCYAWEWEARPYMVWVEIWTQERSGCVTTAAKTTGDLKESWYCVGSNSGGRLWTKYTSEYRRAVMRNNNLSYSGKFTGNWVSNP